VVNRVRVFAFCIVAAFMALVNPGKTLQIIQDILNGD
jgi:hypothetical protein